MGKVLVWLRGKGYGQGYRVMVMLMVISGARVSRKSLVALRLRLREVTNA